MSGEKRKADLQAAAHAYECTVMYIKLYFYVRIFWPVACGVDPVTIWWGWALVCVWGHGVVCEWRGGGHSSGLVLVLVFDCCKEL